jgi:putative component of membrane protein insertase Oxa1/YidC/SpoIIIJ protein YidD
MIGRRILAFAIRSYRRFISGRGPLRRVCCTFASTESCSAYGLRAVEEVATSFPHALGLVRSRLRACRRMSIYRFSSGLGWERDHDRSPAELVALLEARGERADTIAQVLAARTAIAKWRGERAELAAARPIAATAKHRIGVRAGDAAILRHHQVKWRGVTLVVLAALVLTISLWAVVPLLYGAASAISARTSALRLEQQRIAAKFLRPAAS